MGGGRWDDSHYRSYSKKVADKPREQVYRSRNLDPYLDPSKIQFRESRDTPGKESSNPIIIGLDVTGSMGMIAEIIAKEKLGVLVNQILQRKPVTDPHLLFMG